MNDSTTKCCSKCGILKPLSEFHKDSTKKDGHASTCKVCAIERSRKNYTDNKERASKAGKKYREENKERILKRQKAYAERNRERRKEYLKRTADRIREWNRQYRADHPEKRAAARVRVAEWRKTPTGELKSRVNAKKSVAKRRAQRRNNPGSLSAKDIREQYERQKGRCYYCKAKVGQDYHVDHVVPLSRGGDNDKWNIVITCPACNLSKGSKLLHEWTNRLC